MLAGDLMRELESDPVWVAKRDERDRVRQAESAQARALEQPIIDELKAGGYAFDSVYALLNAKGPRGDAVAVLVRHLARPYPDKLRTAIASTFAVLHADIPWTTLVELYRNEQSPHVKERLAAAVAEACTQDTADEIIELFRDPSLGDSRVLLVRAIARHARARLESILLAARAEPMLVPVADQYLAKLERSRKQRAKRSAAKKPT